MDAAHAVLAGRTPRGAVRAGWGPATWAPVWYALASCWPRGLGLRIGTLLHALSIGANFRMHSLSSGGQKQPLDKKEYMRNSLPIESACRSWSDRKCMRNGGRQGRRTVRAAGDKVGGRQGRRATSTAGDKGDAWQADSLTRTACGALGREWLAARWARTAYGALGCACCAGGARVIAFQGSFRTGYEFVSGCLQAG